MKRLLTSLLLTAATVAVSAQPADTESPACRALRENAWLAGSNYLDYDRQLPDFKYTKAPKGYVPFYFTHYGRHGSRWLIGKDDYERVLRPLRKARRQDKLSREGQEVLRRLELFNKTTYKRLGDLTTVGERQHHGIGRRIARHFPEIFLKKGVAIDARSTVVNRCILSMIAECEELMAANPTARIHNDVSESLQDYLNQGWSDRLRQASRRGHPVRDSLTRLWTHPERLMQRLFTDQQWTRDSIQAGPLMRNIFEVVINMQSHDDGPDMLALFTPDELYDQWRIRNVGWYLDYGAAPQTGGVMPFSQTNLLRNFIATADSCVSLGKTQATMRFGHEVCVMPLACLMELDGCGVSVDDLSRLDYYWQNYRIFPMACNIQLVFYKSKRGGDAPVLVKALLNEREVTLPAGETTTPYYYRWDELRQYWCSKLDRSE